MTRTRHARAWFAALAAAAAILGLYAGYRSTVPYDPLASPQGVAVVYDGLVPGEVVTAIAEIGSPGGERPVILGATALRATGARVLGIRGLTNASALTLWPGGPRIAASHVSMAGALRALPGLRFVPPTAATPRTHAWIAVTVRIERRGCFALPPLRLRYAVGSTQFTRLVDVPVGISTAGNDHQVCANTLLPDG